MIQVDELRWVPRSMDRIVAFGRPFANVRSMNWPATIDDFAAAFSIIESEGVQGYVNGGAGAELTVGRNLDAWDAIEIRPRALAGVGTRDLSTTVLGVSEEHPIVVAPVGFQGYVHSEGEIGLAQGSVDAKARYCHSTFGASGFTDLEDIDGLRWWFQLYCFEDHGLNKSLVERAEEAGAEAILLTVDLTALGHRDRDLHTGFILRGNRPVACLAEVGLADPRLDPVWASLDHDLSWATLARTIEDASVPVLVKGILRGDDAVMAVEHGAAGVIVSNHGGRQLDTAVPTAQALVDVVDALGGHGEVLVDSGIRKGVDVAKAIGIGATATLVGRPAMWGLGVGGREGVSRVLNLLVEDYDRALALIGARSTDALSPDLFTIPD